MLFSEYDNHSHRYHGPPVASGYPIKFEMGSPSGPSLMRKNAMIRSGSTTAPGTDVKRWRTFFPSSQTVTCCSNVAACHGLRHRMVEYNIFACAHLPAFYRHSCPLYRHSCRIQCYPLPCPGVYFFLSVKSLSRLSLLQPACHLTPASAES